MMQYEMHTDKVCLFKTQEINECQYACSVIRMGEGGEVNICVNMLNGGTAKTSLAYFCMNYISSSVHRIFKFVNLTPIITYA